MASESEIGRVGQVGPARVQSEGKVSSYENVCPPGERDVVPVPASLPGGVTSQDRGQARLSAYENVELPASSQQTGHTHNHAPIPVPPKKRSQQRVDVYEAVSLGKKKGGANSSTSNQANGTSPSNGVGTGQRSPDYNSKRKKNIFSLLQLWPYIILTFDIYVTQCRINHCVNSAGHLLSTNQSSKHRPIRVC